MRERDIQLQQENDGEGGTMLRNYKQNAHKHTSNDRSNVNTQNNNQPTP